MNLEHLKTFREIAKFGSFSEVAKRLHISQPAVSFQVQRLEQELGVQLIDRSQRALSLTEAGKRLLRFAASVDDERENLQRDLERMQEEIAGELFIGASTIPGEYILPPLLAKFKRLHPAVTIHVEISDSLTVISRVRDNTYEIGFCGMVPEGKDLAFFKTGSDEIVLIVNKNHPFASRNQIGAEELSGEPFIFREETSGTQKSQEKLLAEVGIDIRKIAPHLVLGSTQAVITGVAAGAGIAFVSSLALNASCPPEVHRISVRGIRLDRDFYCVYRRDRTASRLNEAFRDFLQIESSQHDKR